MTIDIKALGIVIIALAIGFFVGRETMAPSTAVRQSDAFRSFNHCLAYYAETIHADEAIDAVYDACSNLTNK
ncbi:MAG: hypothetical protein JJT87_19300 [Halomonas sp.]|nr:hypothetical protein [Halomonas sp.]MCC5904063.1 hypothetical protein [Halomonas sp.]